MQLLCGYNPPKLSDMLSGGKLKKKKNEKRKKFKAVSGHDLEIRSDLEDNPYMIYRTSVVVRTA